MKLIYIIKTQLFKISKESSHPITTQYDYSERQYKKLHYHQQIQITYIKKGNGVLFYGNTTVQFSENTLFVIGENISHVFISEKEVIVESLSIYFSSEYLKNIYPESNFIYHFLQQARLGLKVEKVRFRKMIEDVLNKSGIIKITLFLELLEKIGAAEDKKTLSNYQPMIEDKPLDSKRINAVYEFISKHYKTEIKLKDVADLANMTEPSFCRYFKQRTNKTLSQFVMEMRINYASKQLLETDLTIKEICYEVGYNNSSNFLRQFKKILKNTPKEYRNQHIKN